MTVSFLKILFIAFAMNAFTYAQTNTKEPSPEEVRDYYVQTLVKIADPVLTNLSKGKLKKTCP